MGWEKTHEPGNCPKPNLAAIFMRTGAIWRCDECGTRFELTRARLESKDVATIGWRKLS